jgi:uncharacterized membrane protein YkgB
MIVGIWNPQQTWRCNLEQYQIINNATRFLLKDKLMVAQLIDEVLMMEDLSHTQGI